MVNPKGQKLFFPNIVFTMIRSSIPRKDNEFTFRVPVHLTKYDITQYLEQLYSIKVKNVSTTNFPRSVVRSTKRIIPSRKNAVVEIEGQFSYPSPPDVNKLNYPVPNFRATRKPMPQ